MAIGEKQRAASGDVIGARGRAEIGRRVIDGEGPAGAARAIDRDNRRRARLTDTVSGLAERHFGRLVRTGVHPDIVQYPAERSADRTISAGVPAEAHALARQGTQIETRGNIAVTFITESRVITVGICRIIRNDRVIVLAAVDQRSCVAPGRARIRAVLEKPAVPKDQLKCAEVQRRLEAEGMFEVKVRFSVRRQRYVDVHLCRGVGTGKTVTAPEHELAGGRITEVMDPGDDRATRDIE